jgi:capsular polysaccharide export protein
VTPPGDAPTPAVPADSATPAVPAEAPALVVPVRGMARIATLPALFAGFRLERRPGPGAQAVLAWGHKPSGRRAQAIAQDLGLPLWRVEDAFLRSVGLGFETPPLGILVDDLGVYYDASGPSRLEAWAAAPLTPARGARAQALVAAWRAARVSKYNHAREVPAPLAAPCVLVADQTAGDLSIAGAQAGPAQFAQMLEAALDEHPGLPVVLKVHPDVLAGRKRGHFGRLTPGQAARVTLLAADMHPPALIEAAAAVYTVSSQLGFEALLHGRPVRCFGLPFYAGWGLTADALPAPARRPPVALDALVHAAFVDVARYVHPATHAPCTPEVLMQAIAFQRTLRARFPAELHAVAFSRWKKPVLRCFVAGSRVHFVRRAAGVPAGATALLWGVAPAPPQAAAVLRVEDGFLRSVGLGGDLVRPLSWVIDGRGLHYAADAPSDLEALLAGTPFDAALRERAAALRLRIVREGLSKYNVGAGAWQRPAGAARVVLVAGQVEDDAAVRHGAGAVTSNLALLRAARAAAPGAHLVYKPHPDVVAGLRRRGVGEEGAAALADEVVVDVPIGALLGALRGGVDEVHVISSLAGFEALLRGLRVVAHGRPFYAGWGLTDDRAPLPPRRGRTLALDELVAAVLILYPTYVSRRTGAFATPEEALDELLAWRRAGPSTGVGPLRRVWRWINRTWVR